MSGWENRSITSSTFPWRGICAIFPLNSGAIARLLANYGFAVNLPGRTLTHPKLRFIDVFAGCGGLSLGMLKSGCEGLFAVERNPLAFETLKHNLIKEGPVKFCWPAWLPQEAISCEQLLEKYSAQLRRLRGTVDVIVGGPPCQGFSTAGKRDPTDPRNRMTEQYLALVALISPKFIVIENVAGFDMEFDDDGLAALVDGGSERSYAQYIANRLSDLGYHVSAGLINCADFGVPQNRFRFLMICELSASGVSTEDLLLKLKQKRIEFLKDRRLPIGRPVTTREALSDLCTRRRPLVASTDSPVRGFFEALYDLSRGLTRYQALMRSGYETLIPDSRRLPRHKPDTIQYFKLVRSICRPGKSLSIAERRTAGTRKHSTTVLSAAAPAPTVTTLPDDILHYSEPRILTVRESARLQSFPDWFSFRGKYTTGGKQRKLECPRYTQVGNAVPPLLSEAIGELLVSRSADEATRSQKTVAGDLKGARVRKRRGNGEGSAPPKDSALC